MPNNNPFMSLGGGFDPWWQDILQLRRPQFPPGYGQLQTPGINPSAKTPTTTGPPAAGTGGTTDTGTTSNTKVPSKWQQLMPWLVGAGTSIVGSVLTSNAQNKQNQALTDRAKMMDQLARDEMAKREYYASILLPSLLQGLGNRNPGLANIASQRQKALPGYSGGAV